MKTHFSAPDSPSPSPSLCLVYNADSGLFNAVSSWAHKLLSPSTYACPLCRHTYGIAGMLSAWKIFLEHLPYPVRFLYRDQFRENFPDLAEVPLPMILMVPRDGDPSVLIDAETIAQIDGLSHLICLVDETLKTEIALLTLRHLNRRPS